MKKLFFYYLTITLLAVTLTSCSKDDSKTNPVTPSTSSAGLYILNEGVYGQNNSVLSYLNLTTLTVSQNVYGAANNGAVLGDNGNSMTILDNKGYIAVDNSNKIEIIDLTTNKSLGYVDFGTNGSPRQIYMKDSLTGYATSLNTNSVVKFNPVAKTVLKKIPVGSKPEGIVESGGKLFVANSGFGNANTVSVIDISTDNVVSTITVGMNPCVTLKGEDNSVYIVCTGLYPPTDPDGKGAIYKIDPTSLKLTDSLIVKGNPGEACFVNSDIYVVNSSGIMKANFTSHTVSTSPVIEGMKINASYGIVYSLAFDKSTQTLYCGNPKDFTQNGEVVLLSADGVEKGRYTSGGINPGTLVIYKK